MSREICQISSDSFAVKEIELYFHNCFLNVIRDPEGEPVDRRSSFEHLKYKMCFFILILVLVYNLIHSFPLNLWLVVFIWWSNGRSNDGGP